MKLLGWIMLALIRPDLCIGAAVGIATYRAVKR